MELLQKKLSKILQIKKIPHLLKEIYQLLKIILFIMKEKMISRVKKI